MAEKHVTLSPNLRGRKIKPAEHFLADEVYRTREDHTQKKFVPEAMNLSLVTTSRWAEKLSRPQRKGSGRVPRRSPSTLRLNNSNVKRKATARGRAK